MGDYYRNGYHQLHPTWRRGAVLEGGHIGIEFEVEASSGDYTTILDLLPNFDNHLRPICETDGSLDDDSGVEIVFPPVPYEELKKASSVFKQSIKALDGATNHNSRTGMHMNVNCRGWPRRKISLFLAVINNLTSTQIRNLGGRAPTSYCETDPKQEIDYYFASGSTHGRAAEYASNHRIEIRFPKSTTDSKRVNLLVDFIERLDRFCDTVPDDWSPERSIRRIGGTLYGYDANVWDYKELFSQFYRFLERTKKGRRVLNVIEDGFGAIDSEDNPSIARVARQPISEAA